MHPKIKSIFFTKDKFIGNKKAFRISIDGTKMVFYSPPIYLPFGIEYYNGKPILNLEVEPTLNNDLYNFHSSIYQIDSMLNNIANNETEQRVEQRVEQEELQLTKIQKENRQYINQLIKGKQFISCIRSGKNGFLFRTYVKQGAVIKSIDGKNYYKLSELVGRKAKVTIELGNLWIMPETYGYVLNVTEITIY